MKIEYKKLLKIVVLLITSLLIATVSAATYYTMFMDATVGVAGNKVQFWEGADFTDAGGAITDARQKVTFSSMNGQNGSLTTISNPVTINNTHATDSYTIELKLDSWTGTAATPLYYINVTMYDVSTKMGANIYLVPGGAGQVDTTGQQTLGNMTGWRVQWDIYWNGTATSSDSVTVNLHLIVS